IPAVDRLLARPQRRDRLAALVDVTQLRVHHRAQRPAPPMRRIDADHGDTAAAEDAARYRHLERERPGAADDRALVERRMHPLVRQHLLEPLDLLVRRPAAEVLANAVERTAKLVAIARCAYVEHPSSLELFERGVVEHQP